MTISRNISVMAQGASTAGVLGSSYGGLGGNVAPTTAGNVLFTTDGSVWSSTAKIVRGSVLTPRAVSTASFTSIPSWVKRITVIMNGISTTGTTGPIIQIGSGSYVTSGYVGTVLYVAQTNGVVCVAGGTAGFTTAGLSVATATFSCIATLYNMNGNVWAYSSTANRENGTTAQNGYQNATYTPVTLSGVLDRIQLTTNTVNTFDAGTVNILYE